VNAPTDPITRCVAHCSQARAWRGRWRMQDQTCARLMQAGSTHTIAAMTAHAAAALGAWIHERAGAIAREEAA